MTQQLKVVKGCQRYIDELKGNPIPIGYNLKDLYIVLGEVADIKHYIILNMTTGQILPGIFHLEHFEEVNRDDI